MSYKGFESQLGLYEWGWGIPASYATSFSISFHSTAEMLTIDFCFTEFPCKSKFHHENIFQWVPTSWIEQRVWPKKLDNVSLSITEFMIFMLHSGDTAFLIVASMTSWKTCFYSNSLARKYSEHSSHWSQKKPIKELQHTFWKNQLTPTPSLHSLLQKCVAAPLQLLVEGKVEVLLLRKSSWRTVVRPTCGSFEKLLDIYKNG